MEYLDSPTNSTPELTSTISKLIYTEIINNGNADLAFKNGDSSFEPEHFKLVDVEADRIIYEIQSKFNGTFVVEDGFYEVTTETVLKNSLNSDLLDSDVVYTDFKGNKTFDELKEL